MASVTYNCTKDASAYNANDGWSGWDDHHPVGMGSDKYKSFLYFPVNFSGMTGITSATLKLYGHRAVSGNHVYGNASQSGRYLVVRRMTSDWGEGTDRGESLWSSQETWGYDNRAAAGYTTTGQTTHTATSYSEGGLMSIDVTAIVTAWFNGSNNYGFQLHNDDMTTASYGLEFYSRHASTSGYRPTLTIVYTTNTAPNAPTLTSPVGGAATSTLNPSLQGTFSDPDSGDLMSGHQIIVYSDSGGTAQVWDSGTITDTNATTFSTTYSGPALTGNTTYYWKARTRDKNGSAWGAYSALASFKANSAPPTPTGLSPASGATVSTLTPTFSGSSTDADPGDSLASAQIYVYSDAAGTALMSSGAPAASGSTFSWTYTGGTALSAGTTYYWKALVTDQNGKSSNFTSLQPFTTYTVGTPTNMSPANAKVNTLTPTFTATASVTMNLYNIVVLAADGTTEYYNYTPGSASGTAISWTYAGTALAWGTKYFWKVRSRNTSNVWSSFSAPQPFWTNASPVANQTSPASNGVVTTLTPTFTATYSDGDVANGFTDNPTNYYVEVSRVSDSVIMYYLSKSSSLSNGSNSMKAGDAGVTQTAGAGGTTLTLNTQYRWRARFTDSSGAANAQGSYSGYLNFKPTAAPTATSFVAQAGDLDTGVLNKPNPTFAWTFTGSGGKTQQSYSLKVTRTYDSVEVYQTSATTTATSAQIPQGYLQNFLSDGVTHATYKFDLTVTDTDALTGTATVTYMTTWTPPPVVENFSATGDESRGYIFLDWDTSTLSAGEFMYYTVYRSTDAGATWTLAATITNQSESEWSDFASAQGVAYTYKVTQWKNLAGVGLIESLDGDIVTTSLDADQWWLIVPERDDLCMPLYVEDESHSEPFQQEVFEPFGRRRKVIVRSGILGREGDLSFYVLSEDRADFLDNRLPGIAALGTPIYLKSPFGDTHSVFLDAPTIQYLPGGAARVSMHYTEVDA